jgi:hypothetical protein
MLRPLSFDIQKQESEIEDAQVTFCQSSFSNTKVLSKGAEDWLWWPKAPQKPHSYPNQGKKKTLQILFHLAEYILY